MAASAAPGGKVIAGQGVGEGLGRAMNDQNKEAWGERLVPRGGGAGTREGSKGGIPPLRDEAAAQVRPATLEELRGRYPGLPDDEVARRLIDRAARTAAGLALLVGGGGGAPQALTGG